MPVTWMLYVGAERENRPLPCPELGEGWRAENECSVNWAFVAPMLVLLEHDPAVGPGLGDRRADRVADRRPHAEHQQESEHREATFCAVARAMDPCSRHRVHGEALRVLLGIPGIERDAIEERLRLHVLASSCARRRRRRDEAAGDPPRCGLRARGCADGRADSAAVVSAVAEAPARPLAVATAVAEERQVPVVLDVTGTLMGNVETAVAADCGRARDRGPGGARRGVGGRRHDRRGHPGADGGPEGGTRPTDGKTVSSTRSSGSRRPGG